MTTRGCPKGIVKRKPHEIRALILGELAHDQCTRGQLRQTLGLSHTVVLNYIDHLVDEGVVVSAGKAPSGKGGASPVLYRLRHQSSLPVVSQEGVRTQIRGPWPTAETVQRARSTRDLITSSRG